MIAEESRVRRAASALLRRLPTPPAVAVVLGSGLGALEFGRVTARIPYRAIPGFPEPGAAGHAGVVTACGPVVALRGRAHFYEGYSMDEVVRPVRALAAAGAKTIVLTNAAGGIRRSFRPGDLMAIRDHLNLMGTHPLRGGPRFVDLTDAYDPGLRALARAAARRLRVPLREGVYAAVSGPAYETPAEVGMLRTLGADAVGMSTVPEAIAAREAGARVLAISVVTNAAAGTSPRPVSHAEVLDASARAAGRLGALLREILARLGPGRPS